MISARKNFFFFVLLTTLFSCSRDEVYLQKNGYPNEINKIVTTKCAVSGCHTAASKDAAGGLDLTSWDKLFEGGRGGAVIIPYRSDQSWLMYFINTYSDLGIRLLPTMPFNESPLSREEVLTFKAWIDKGAPDDKGFVKFSDDPKRRKIYVTNQGCDVVSIFDAKTKLVMRYIDVGNTNNIESPHMVRVSPDGKYWYVIFTAGDVIQKFDAGNDKYIGEANIGNGNWNTFVISPDSRLAYIVDWSSDGSIAKVDLENMQLIKRYQGSGLFFFPHGIAANKNFTTLYVTAQTGNFIYKIDTADANFTDYKQVVLEQGQPVNYNSSLDPHEIVFSPDESKYFVTCQASNEVRVMQTSNDSLLAVIPAGVYPVEMSFSKTKPYLFVTSMETPCTGSLCKGSVTVIDYNTNVKIKEITGGFFQPHGLIVDDENGVVYVASRNVATNGPAPHHTSTCGGRNGFIRLIDLNTLEIIPGFKSEVAADPYSVAVRE